MSRQMTNDVPCIRQHVRRLLLAEEVIEVLGKPDRSSDFTLNADDPPEGVRGGCAQLVVAELRRRVLPGEPVVATRNDAYLELRRSRSDFLCVRVSRC